MVSSDHTSATSDEVLLEREGCRSSARGETELCVDVLQVSSHGVLADHQRTRDLAIALASRNQT